MDNYQHKFIEEVKELIAEIETDLLAFEKDKNNIATLENIARVMHTLKGSSSMFGFDNIVEITHTLESLFKKIKNNELIADTQIIDLTFSVIDIINKILDDKNLKNTKNTKKYELTISKLNTYFSNDELSLKTQQHNNPDFALYYISFEPDDDIDERGVHLRTIFKEVDELGKTKVIPKTSNKKGKHTLCWEIFIATDKDLDDIEEVFMFVELETTITLISEENLLLNSKFISEISENTNNKHISKPEKILNIAKQITNEQKDKTEDNKQPSETSQEKNSTIRVNTNDLDVIMNSVSELITLKSKLQLSAKNSKNHEIIEIGEHLDKLSNIMKDTMLKLRLFPLDSVQIKFERLIRDMSGNLGKEINFTTENLNIKLDKNIIESLTAPLLHIIRNSIDHGIETPENRIKKGKPKQGEIKITAQKNGSLVNIIIFDDGAGINKEIVRNKAISKKLITADQKLSDNEIYKLIFTHGFSTADNISEISGRGVGMEIVKTEIEKQRGSIFIESEEDKGTQITIKIPVSISILDTILIKTGKMYFAIPIEDISQCRIVDEEISVKSDNDFLKINKELIPYINLTKSFNITSDYQGKQRAVVIKNNGKPKAIITDRIIGKFQAIMKPISEIFNNNAIAGVSYMPDGNTAYILDVNKNF